MAERAGTLNISVEGMLIAGAFTSAIGYDLTGSAIIGLFTGIAGAMIIAGVQQGQNVDALAHGFLEAHWRDDADLADAGTIEQIATRCGYDGQALLDAASSADVIATYTKNTEEAISRSVFGSPTYFVDGDMFYGQDRLEFIERALVQAFRGE